MPYSIYTGAGLFKDTIHIEKVPRLTRERFKLYNVFFSFTIVSIVSLVNCIGMTALKEAGGRRGGGEKLGWGILNR